MRAVYKLSTTGAAMESHSTIHLIDDNIGTLKQGIELIGRLDDRLYTQPNHELYLSGVGAHFRHCADFYHSFFIGVESGRINYDLRERDERLEKNRVFAIAKLDSIVAALSRTSLIANDRVFETLLEGSSSSDWSISSLKRELQFLLSHTVHHYSLIALALRLQGFEPGAAFGVAPSTLKNWNLTH